MVPTSVSLLDRLKLAPSDSPEWKRLHSIYHPLIERWLLRLIGARSESADLAQDIFLIVFRELPKFDRRRDGAFRAWLRTITANEVKSFWRKQKRLALAGLQSADGDDVLAQLQDSASALSVEWDREHDRHVFQKLMTAVGPDFGETAWTAFREFALNGKPANQVARELGITINAVLQAKSRILKRLREEAAGLID